MYKNKNLKLEDLYKATEYIKVFDTLKPKLSIDKRNIKNFKSIVDMFNVIKPYMESGEPIQSSTSLEKEIKQKEVKRLYEDDKWLVVEPLTERAACYYGKNTEWCTAAKENNRFEYYNKQGPLYINIDKVNNEKYQFHFESSQFMDENDSDIDLMEFMDNNKSLRNFYNEFLKDKAKYVSFVDLKQNDGNCYLHAKNWSEFSGAFEDDRNHGNPADYLNEMQDDYWDYEYSISDLDYHFDKINESNLKFMINLLIKNGDITSESTDDDIKEAILGDDELSNAIERALAWTEESADKDYAYDSIVNEIKDFFGVTAVTYENDGIHLKLNNCPEPVVIYGIDNSSFIDGYCEKFGRIDYNYPYYGFGGQGNPDWEQFNEYLSDNLHGI